MNSKGFGSKQSWPNFMYYPSHEYRDERKNEKLDLLQSRLLL